MSGLIKEVQELVRLIHPLNRNTTNGLAYPVQPGTEKLAAISEALSDTELFEKVRITAEQQDNSHPNKQSTETRNQMTEAGQTEKRVAINTAQIRKADLELNELKLAFLKVWIDEDLAGRFNALLHYRQLLNKHLDAILNLREVGFPKQSSPPRLSDTNNDIVEVLSINRPVETGIQNIAAILTRRNGSTETIAIKNLEKDRTEIYNDNSLIRYDLKSLSDLGQSSTDAFVECAPNFALQIREALCFDEEDDRRIEVKNAHTKTYHWIFEENSTKCTTRFRSWLETGHGCYWINGKAGSGKSTLMKYIHQNPSLLKLLHAWSGTRQLIAATFFFWHAGEPLQKSHEGVLRSLLRQVLEKRPSLTPIVFPRISRYFLRQGQLKFLKISCADLQDAMLLLTSNLPEDLTLFLMIDGVDEYAGNHFDFCKLLTSLARNMSVKVLVSSRPLPACHQVFSRSPGLRLQDLTAGDIRAYVDEELLQDQLVIEMDHLEPGFAEEVKEALMEKSSGVFLWIVLVVRRLIIALGNYDDRAALMAKIDELPNDLERLYDHMFRSMSEEYQREGSLLIQLVRCARDIQHCPLTALQLFMANQGQDAIKFSSQEVSYKQETESLYVKALDGKIRSRCCGLVEVQYSTGQGILREPKVNFFHRTVYEYLNEPQVWSKVKSLHNLPPIDANLSLLASCIHVLNRQIQKFASKSPVSTLLMERFTACLDYSHQLICLGDDNHVDLLEAADTIFQGLCQRASITSSYCMYERVCELFTSHHEYLLPEDHISGAKENLPPLSYLLMVGRLGFPSFFARKVHNLGSDLITKSLMLIHVLDVMTQHSRSKFVPFQMQNIMFLLDEGANPNTAAKQISLGYNSTILTEAASLSGDAGRDLTPWNFWIVSCNNLPQLHPEHIRVTLHLLNAGATFDGPNERKANAIENFKRRLQNDMKSYAETELQPTLETILSLLTPLDNSQESRKRKRKIGL